MHVITGTIRKAPYTKTGNNSKGEWKLYAIELSESWKDKEGQRHYSNYRASMFASTPGSIGYNDEMLVEGAVVSISSECLQVVSRESNGKMYTHLEMIQPRVVFAKAPESGQQTQAQQQREPQPPNRPAPQLSAPAADFDDSSIPF